MENCYNYAKNAKHLLAYDDGSLFLSLRYSLIIP